LEGQITIGESSDELHEEPARPVTAADLFAMAASGLGHPSNKQKQNSLIGQITIGTSGQQLHGQLARPAMAVDLSATVARRLGHPSKKQKNQGPPSQDATGPDLSRIKSSP
jgi:hypothetical protein